MLTKKTTALTLLLVAIAWTCACGGSNMGKEKTLTQKTLDDTPEDYDVMTALLGENPELDTEGLDDDTAEPQQAMDPATTHDKDHIGGSMAAFLPTVKASNEEISATYSIAEATAEGTVIMSDVPSGQEVEIAPGVYDITFSTKEIAGHPQMTMRGVEFTAGRRLRQNVKFPVGEITLTTGGKGCRKAAIRIKAKDGDWLPGKFSTCKPIKLMAGEYEAKQGTIDISGIVVYDGGKRNVSIRQQ